MNTTADEQKLRRQIVKTQIAGTPGTVCLALGVYGVFFAKGEAFLDFLNDPFITHGLLVTGIAVTGWEIVRLFSLVKRLEELRRGSGHR